MIILGENIPLESHEAHKKVSRPVYEPLQGVSRRPLTFAHAIIALLIRTMDLSA